MTDAVAGPARSRLRLPPGRVLAGGAIVAVVAAAALGAPWLAPNDPYAQDLFNTLLPPAWLAGGDPQFPLGTDSLGRCLLTQLIYGARVALFVGLFAAIGAMVLGSALGVAAGYFGGRTDRAIGSLTDLWMSIPPVVLSITLMVGLGTGIGNVVLAIILVDWTRFCRVVRSEVMVIRRLEYIAAARMLGFSHGRVIGREVLPAAAPLILTLFTLQVGIGVVVEAVLSFIGMSVEADVPAWGKMIADARSSMYQAPWGMILPVLAIFITVLGFSLLGDGLRTALDPRLKGRAAS